MALVLGLAVSGCAGSLFHHKKDPVAVLRIHVESETSTAGTTKGIELPRSRPVAINIQADPVLTEADLVAAQVVEASGSFSIQLNFEETAGWKLEQATAINPGKHLAVYGHWGEKPEDGRWIAAPVILRRNATGTLTFSPDASREEMDLWVKGLNVAAKKNAGVKSKD